MSERSWCGDCMEQGERVTRERDTARVEAEVLREALHSLLLRVESTPRECGGSGEARGAIDPLSHDAHSDAHDWCHEAIGTLNSPEAAWAGVLLSHSPTLAALRAREALAALAEADARRVVDTLLARDGYCDMHALEMCKNATNAARAEREKAEKGGRHE